MFNGAYSGRRVLLTGHTGFKGGWLLTWLNRLGATVTGYSLKPPTNPSLFERAGLAEVCEHVEADIRDRERMNRVVADTKADVIFHLAAAPLVRESYSDPFGTFEINVMGTLALLDAVRKAGRPCAVVLVSTDKCYENREWEFGYRETDPMGGHDPYSASKGAMEVAVASYRRSFFSNDKSADQRIGVATARAGNVIGGGDWSPERIVPDAIRAMESGRPLVVRNPRAVRPWQHVLEPLSGYLWLGARLAEERGGQWASGWNFGPSPLEQYNVGALADAVVKCWGAKPWVDGTDPNAPHEAGMLKLAIDKAAQHLGWRPVWDFATTVTRTVEEYRALGSARTASAARAVLQSDIERYESDAGAAAISWTR